MSTLTAELRQRLREAVDRQARERAAAADAHEREVAAEAATMGLGATCLYCGGEFFPTNPQRRYCSRAHANLAWHYRRRPAQTAPIGEAA